MSTIYLTDTCYDTTVSRLTAILNTGKPTDHHPERPVSPTLQFNLASALWCAKIEGGRVLDPAFTKRRQGMSLIVGLAEMDRDPHTGLYERDQIQWTLWDAGVFPARAMVEAA
ncbi:hypothetical protein [Manganibacter manganicus]|uniref:Uncharacterized protein n=1 Tax=Manganibacter manganicus TaxID=1873176 RepID=A0A1V8RNB6_9HYPH|nr:hypothetical protein [Pseudaminobacter manganicus]OQM74705.1 hypothetical protein BFN67_03450 [Pseudaminobacter manganicus]